MANKETFILYDKYAEQLDILTNEQAGELFKAIYTYRAGREVEFSDAITKMAFSIIRQQMEHDEKKYQEVCEKRKAAGSAGGRAKAEHVANASKEVANASKEVANASKEVANASKEVANPSKDVASENVCYDLPCDNEYEYEYDHEYDNDLIEEEEGEEGDAGASEREAELLRFVEQELTLPLSGVAIERVQAWLKEWRDIDVIRLAVTEAVSHGARNIAYVDAVLANWQKSGVQDAASAKARLAAFSESKARERPKAGGKGTTRAPVRENFKSSERDLSWLEE